MATGAGRWSLRMAGRLWWSPVVLLGMGIDRGSRLRWSSAPAIVVLTASAATVAKLVIRRPRPGATCRVAPLWRLGAAGFPSTHTACAFAIASWLRGSRACRALHLVAIGIGYLRVRRGAHHYSDVAAGAALGYGVAWKIDAMWWGLADTRTARGERSVGEPRPVEAPESRSAPAPLPRRVVEPRHGATSGPVGHGVLSRPTARGRGRVIQRERLAAILSVLAVR